MSTPETPETAVTTAPTIPKSAAGMEATAARVPARVLFAQTIATNAWTRTIRPVMVSTYLRELRNLQPIAGNTLR